MPPPQQTMGMGEHQLQHQQQQHQQQQQQHHQQQQHQQHQQPADAISYLEQQRQQLGQLEQQRQLLRSSGHMGHGPHGNNNNNGAGGMGGDPGGIHGNGVHASGAQGVGTNTHVGPPRGPRGGRGPGGNVNAQGGAGNQRAPSQRPQRPSEEQRALFGLNLDKVRSGADVRSTLMVRNIPNKYSQKLLLEALEQHHGGKIDLLYLPIDFKNKCNVGYAFVNFISPSAIPAFYEEFNHRLWDRFNSNKVCEITYARIQSKVALIKHFVNSALAREDEGYQPVVFASDGSGRREKLSLGGARHVELRRGDPRTGPAAAEAQL